VRVLLRKQKSNPVLIGEPGVGKTSVVEGLALTAAASDAPREIRDFRIVEVMMSSLLAETTYRGELEEKLEKILKEAEADPLLVIFFDEFHTLVGAGTTKESPLDVANMLKPALGRGRLRCIGATTIAEYRKYVERDAALERRFQPVLVKEPTAEEARAILEGLRPSYEEFHRVAIADEALDSAVALSIRYLPERRLPDKARDLIDQAAVNVRVFNLAPHGKDLSKTEVTADDVVQVAAEWSGVPLERMSVDDRKRLLHMEDALAHRVVGQDDAITAVSAVIRTALAGLSHPHRPHGVFLFMGPTGVGKTELAKALAEFLFHDDKALVRFDMSEFMEELAVSKLIGAPPGYVGHDEGGRLTDAVRTSPYCVVLLDEIEKAHHDVIGVFLQVFDEGHLTDSKGRRVDFTNTVIIMTSNLGADLSAGGRQPIGFESSETSSSDAPSPEKDREALLAYFKPELVNRINGVVRFRSLVQADIRKIIDKLLERVAARLRDKELSIRLAPAAYDVLMSLGYSEESGVREMERAIERYIVAPLAEGVISGGFVPGSTVEVVPRDGQLVIEKARSK
jgi:ATP-dependent Clp protease ATP-binding subunit ClpC